MKVINVLRNINPYIVLLISTTLSCLGSSAQVNENFSNGELLNNPQWQFSNEDFVVNDSMLQSNNSTPNSKFWMTTQVDQLEEMEWKFWIDLKIATSSANFVEFHLLSDTSALDLSSGYILRIGGTKDDIRLIKKINGSEVILIDGPDKMTEYGTFRFRILYENDTWKLYLDPEGGESYAFLGVQIDSAVLAYSRFGILIRQSSSSFHQKHFFDDLYIGPIIKDTTGPKLLSADNHSKNIQLTFDEKVLVDDANIYLTPDAHFEVTSEHHQIILTFDTLINGTYQLWLHGVKDSLENVSDTMFEFDYVNLHYPKRGDILINEVLFNPFTDGVDFVELYNNTSKHMILNGNMARVKDSSISDHKELDSTILAPLAYMAFSSDTTKLKTYHPNAMNLKQVYALPPMNNQEEVVVLLDSGLMIIDSIYYHEDFHFQLLDDFEGVSLERIYFNKLGTDSDNWHSASSDVGYATPGFQNSQFQKGKTAETKFSLRSDVISPDGDGVDDLLHLLYSVPKGWVLNGYVFTASGHFVHHVFSNKTLSTSGYLNWDGILNDGSKLPIERYILYIEAFDLNGELSRVKIPFSVVARF